MDEDQDKLYKLFCLIENSSTAFSVTIVATETVDDLKKRIKDEKSNALQNVDADQLKLWKVEIPDDQEIDFSSLAPEDELKPTRRINRYWEATPLEDHIHVCIRIQGNSKLLLLHPHFAHNLC